MSERSLALISIVLGKGGSGARAERKQIDARDRMRILTQSADCIGVIVAFQRLASSFCFGHDFRDAAVDDECLAGDEFCLIGMQPCSQTGHIGCFADRPQRVHALGDL